MSRLSKDPRQKFLPIPDLQRLIAASEKSDEARDTVRAMLRFKKQDHQAWRGYGVIPPGSVLDVVCETFRRETDIPLELPLMGVLSFVSARLLKLGAKIDLNGQSVDPTLWSVVLAASGSGKTFSTNRVQEMTGETHLFPEPASAAKFIQDLSNWNRSLWVRDEFGTFLKSLDQQTYMAEMRDYLLRLYDGQEITRRTKAEEITVANPALTILGLSVFESFKNCVSAESLVDGFAQRFNFIIAPSDPTRKAEDFPLYHVSEQMPTLRQAWRRVERVPIHANYRVGEDGISVFKAAFKSLRPTDEDLPMSFFRRVMFSAVRYAAVFHIINLDDGDELTGEDFAWAGRMVALHIEDAKNLLDDYGLGDLERIVRRVEGLKAEFKASGKNCKPRDLIRRISAIKTAEQARSLLRLVGEK